MRIRSAARSLSRLVEGNARFVSGSRSIRPLAGAGRRYFPIPYQAVNDLFAIARERASLLAEFDGVDFHVHDLRGTFAVHRSVVVRGLRQLEVELGHSDWKSLQSYLDRADQLSLKESIFHFPPPPPAPLAQPIPAVDAESRESEYPRADHLRPILH